MRAIELNGIKIDENKEAFTWGRIVAEHADEVGALAGIEAKGPATLDEIIARRAEFLVGYQGRRWADDYRTGVARVVEAETRVAGAPGALSEAAARGLFKLMSYKDEYEVARLHTETGFVEGLAKQFEGGFAVRHHLAPPLLPGGKDAEGRPLKRSFGPWVRLPMKILAKCKVLRGTAVDVFGYTEERRMERALIVEYGELLDRLCAALTPENRDEAARLAGLAMEIRGFGPVKAEAVETVRRQWAEGLDGLDGGEGLSRAA